MTIENYRSLVDRRIVERNGELLLNGSPHHASVIVERMFAHAIKRVRILSRRLDPRIYGEPDLVAEAERFISLSDRTLEILVESKEATGDHPLLDICSDCDNFRMRQVPEFLHDVVQYNFSTMDDDGYRYEEDKLEPTAVAQFGQNDLAKRLNTIFDTLWEHSPELQPA